MYLFSYLYLKFLTLCLISLVMALESPSTPAWSWKCVKDGEGNPRCVREKSNSISTAPISSTTCHMTCDPSATLVPKPRRASLEKKLVSFLPAHMTYSPTSCPDKICSMLSEAFDRMKSTVLKYHPKFGELDPLWERPRASANVSKHNVLVKFFVSGREEYLTLATDESYTLEITTEGIKTTVKIMAPTYFGARHALETLSQLIDYDIDNDALQIIKSGAIDDSPAFPYRGLIVDTSRNFFPTKVLKRIIDGMSYNKLNYFHWHISDTQAFPLVIKTYPKMSYYGAYAPEKVYTREDVMDIVQYARVRGVRVIPELDAPAHVGHGWQWGEEEGLGPLVVCLDKQPWNSYCAGPPCGQMNLANENLYKVLGNVYKEIMEMFGPIEMFHYGGDEINLNCWNTSSEMTEWMTSKGYELDDDAYYRQWGIFQERARYLVRAANGGTDVPGILWTSTSTEKGRADRYLDKDKYIIQVWTTGTDPIIKELLEKGFRIIMSNHDAVYLDCGVSSFVGKGPNWCSPYKGWQDVYDNDISKMVWNLTGSDAYSKQILGGEGAAWSEQIDENTIDAKLWPRGAALAERLWTNPAQNYTFVEMRMLHHRQRLVQRGLQAERLQPEWCSQNEGECRWPWQPKEEKQIPQESEDDLPLLVIRDDSLVSRSGSRSWSLSRSTNNLYFKSETISSFFLIIMLFNACAFLC